MLHPFNTYSAVLKRKCPLSPWVCGSGWNACGEMDSQQGCERLSSGSRMKTVHSYHPYPFPSPTFVQKRNVDSVQCFQISQHWLSSNFSSSKNFPGCFLDLTVSTDLVLLEILFLVLSSLSCQGLWVIIFHSASPVCLALDRCLVNICGRGMSRQRGDAFESWQSHHQPLECFRVSLTN